MEVLSSPKQNNVLGKPKQPGLPPVGRWGEAVPKTGTHCSNCEYLKDAAKMICGEPNLIIWNGSNKIPSSSPDTYCSIWWEGKKEKS